METTAVVVRMWMAQAGLSASEVAKRAGVSASTVHRMLHGQADPSVGTLREVAFACGLVLDLAADDTGQPAAAAAARALLDDRFLASDEPEIEEWMQRLPRLAQSEDPVAILTTAAHAANPLTRPDAVLYRGEVGLLRLASVGDASTGPGRTAQWALSGPAGLSLPDGSLPAPATTILWCSDAHRVTHLMAATGARTTTRTDRADIAVVPARPEVFTDCFEHDGIRYVAPIQIALDCIAQGGTVARDALDEIAGWGED